MSQHRSADLNTSRFALAYPKPTTGKIQLVLNTDKFWTAEQAQTCLCDRIANGEAFPGEHVVELWIHAQWFGEHTSGEKEIAAFLVPHSVSSPDVFAALKSIIAVLSQPVQTSMNTLPSTCDILRGDCTTAVRIAQNLIAKLSDAQNK